MAVSDCEKRGYFSTRKTFYQVLATIETVAALTIVMLGVVFGMNGYPNGEPVDWLTFAMAGAAAMVVALVTAVIAAGGPLAIIRDDCYRIC